MGKGSKDKDELKARMNRYLVDTTVLVEHLRGNARARKFIEDELPAISVVSMAELIQGARDKIRLKSALEICQALTVVDIDKKISYRAIRLLEKFYLSKGLLFLDALIAASAIELKKTLVTANVKHFGFIAGLEVIPQGKVL